MKPRHLILIAWIACGSCDNSHSKPVQVAPVEENEKTVRRFDTLYIRNASLSTKVRFDEFRKLQPQPAGNELNQGIASLFSSYCGIDSLKSVKRYEEYVNRLDIGMMADANLYQLDEIVVNGINWKVLMLTFTSYEACPVYNGTIVTAYNIASRRLTTLAKEYRASDPPSTMQEVVSSVITADSIIAQRTVISDDLDVPGINKEHQRFGVFLGDLSRVTSGTVAAQNGEAR